MQVTYIEHSGFLVELEDVYFLFDYYKGGIPKMNPKKDIVVFVSHKHGDHYNSAIFGLLEEYPHVKYILSHEVPIKWFIAQEAEKGRNVEPYLIKVRKKQDYEFTLHNGKLLKVHTLKSTDLGVAYLVSYGDKTIYHAGDLNLWLWSGETAQANENMRKAFGSSMEDLRGKSVDVAFVPLDPRQEEDSFAGLLAYLEVTNTKKVFPMHCWGNYNIIKEFLEEHPLCGDVVQMVSQEGQVFRL